MHRGHRRPRGYFCGGQRKQFQRRRRDHAERALSGDEQIAQVVTGVVLTQTAQTVPDFTLRRHHFEPETQLTRITKTQHRHAACVGRKIAANGARTFRRQRQRKQPPRLTRRVLHRLQNTTRVHRHRVVQCINATHPIHARQRQHQRVARRIWRCRPGHAGVTALRHDRHALRGTPAHDDCHILRRVRLRHRDGAARPALAPIGHKRCDIRSIGEQAA